MQIEKEGYERAYQAAHDVERGTTTLTAAMASLASVGLNPNSARDLISAVQHMLAGRVYKRGISIPATDDYLRWIRRDHGDEVLRAALAAVEAHIAYNTGSKGQARPGLVAVVEQHRDALGDGEGPHPGITEFFEHVLGAKLRNQQWAWGAEDLNSGRLFLRVWQDELSQGPTGEEVLVFNREVARSSPGYAERKRHLEQIQSGAEAYGVLCVAADPSAKGKRRIKTFDRAVLLRLGPLHERTPRVYAEIVGRVPTARLLQSGNTAHDLDEISKDLGMDQTTKESLVNARIGQGKFRDEVLRLWGNRCAVTGVSTLAAIRASHIKPWRHSDNTERLDPRNGLPLVASLDALFDVGLITFDDAGKLQVSQHLECADHKALLGGAGRLRAAPSAPTQAYLAEHREKVFKG